MKGREQNAKAQAVETAHGPWRPYLSHAQFQSPDVRLHGQMSRCRETVLCPFTLALPNLRAPRGAPISPEAFGPGEAKGAPPATTHVPATTYKKQDMPVADARPALPGCALAQRNSGAAVRASVRAHRRTPFHEDFALALVATGGYRVSHAVWSGLRPS